MIAIGDAIERMGTLDDESVDVVLTDPPYSSGTRREGAKGLRGGMTRSKKDRAEWFGTDSLTALGFSYLMRGCALQWHRLLREGGHLLSFIDWRMAWHLAGAIESADLRSAGLLVWDKTSFGMGHCFRNQHELILHFTKGKGREPSRRDVGNVLGHLPIRGGNHPTEKPVGLLKTLLSVVSRPGDTVLDPFAGSGAVGEAAIELGCRFVGIERERLYVLKARSRLEAVAKQGDLYGAT